MTAKQYANRMSAFPVILEGECRREIGAVGISAVAFCKMKMDEEIYAIPEDRTAKGESRFQKQREQGGRRRPFIPRKGDRKWVRTGALRRAERFIPEGPYAVRIINSMVYARSRHDAGKIGPGFKHINPLRESHWRDEMVDVFESVLLDSAESAMQRAMEKVAR